MKPAAVLNWLRKLVAPRDRRARGTWRDLTKRALEERGLLYFADVQQDIRNRLARVDGKAATALAAGCASRLMAAHESLPRAQQRPFTLEWKRPLTLVWEALAADDPEPSSAGVRQALDRFYASPYSHSPGQAGPDDADEDAAAAAIDAAESLCKSEPAASAYWAAARLIDWAFQLAQAEVEPLESRLSTIEQFTAQAAHPLVQRELHRVLDGLALLETRGADSGALHELREMFTTA